MKNKKMIAFLVTLTVTLSLAGCGGSSTASIPTDSGIETEATTTSTEKISETTDKSVEEETTKPQESVNNESENAETAVSTEETTESMKESTEVTKETVESTKESTEVAKETAVSTEETTEQTTEAQSVNTTEAPNSVATEFVIPEGFDEFDCVLGLWHDCTELPTYYASISDIEADKGNQPLGTLQMDVQYQGVATSGNGGKWWIINLDGQYVYVRGVWVWLWDDVQE